MSTNTLTEAEFARRFVRRDDLVASASARSVWCAPDTGNLVQRRSGWYVSNDSRLCKIGVEVNRKLCQPTLGPFPTKADALAVGYRAWRRKGLS